MAGVSLAMAAAVGVGVPLTPTVVEPDRPAATREVRLSPTQALDVGARFEAAGKTASAAQIYRTLQQDANGDVRAEARFRLAKMAVAAKQWKEAALLLRRVLDDKPQAAPVRLTLAKVLTEIGDTGAAYREVRAVQAGVLPPEVARQVDRFSAALRARRPFGVDIEVALAPDSNIANATSSDTLGTVIGDFDISRDSQERSGIGLSVRTQMFARRPVGERVNLLARLNASGNLYRDRDFNQMSFDLSGGAEMSLGTMRLNLEAGVTRRWFGRDVYQNSVRVGANVGRPLGRTTYLRANASVARIDNRLNDLQDGTQFAGGFSLEHAIDARTGVGGSISGQRDRMADPGYSLRGWRTGLFGWREIGRTTLTVNAAAGRTEADKRLLLFPDKRRDRYFSAGAGASFRSLSAWGLAPFVRLSFERNKSTIAFYDYRRKRVEFGFSRAF